MAVKKLVRAALEMRSQEMTRLFTEMLLSKNTRPENDISQSYISALDSLGEVDATKVKSFIALAVVEDGNSIECIGALIGGAYEISGSILHIIGSTETINDGPTGTH